ncbi:MAG: Sir2 family NAD-dependent protein deacetylase [Pseudomonadota bacterium]
MVWFGETLDEAILQRAWTSVQHAECLLVIGTSGLVHPAATLPSMAKRAGARVLEINPEPTAITEQADWHLQGSSAYWLPRLAKAASA